MIRLPRKLKKALKKWFSIFPNAICIRHHGKTYFVVLHEGKLYIEKPFYDAPASVSLQELSLACQLEEKLNRLTNSFPYYG